MTCLLNNTQNIAFSLQTPASSEDAGVYGATPPTDGPNESVERVRRCIKTVELFCFFNIQQIFFKLE